MLLAGPQAPLSSDLIEAVSDTTREPPTWLAGGTAVEFDLDDRPDWNAMLRTVIGPAPVDLAIVPATDRRKRLLIADMDSTIIEQECIDELADMVGKRDEVSAITERAMRGEVEFADALRHRVALLAGLPIDTVRQVLRERINVRSGAAELVATMRANGAYTMLVSGGFTLFTSAIAATVGFDEHRANVLNHDGTLFDGTVAEPILGREAKLEALRETISDRDIRTDDVIAVGDGANDLAMIEAAGLGVALHAKPAVAARADVSIRYGDLRSLLHLQGYRADEFVRP